MLVVARPNGRFLFFFLILLPFTLGIGSLALWLWRRSFVRQVGPQGILLWGGRAVGWSEVEKVMTRKGREEKAGEVLRTDISFAGGRAVIAPRWLENGAELTSAVLAEFRAFRKPDKPLRVQSLHKRR